MSRADVYCEFFSPRSATMLMLYFALQMNRNRIDPLSLNTKTYPWQVGHMLITCLLLACWFTTSSQQLGFYTEHRCTNCETKFIEQVSSSQYGPKSPKRPNVDGTRTYKVITSWNNDKQKLRRTLLACQTHSSYVRKSFMCSHYKYYQRIQK